MTGIPDQIRSFLEKISPKREKIDRIVLVRKAADDIIDFARSNFPNEFVAVLEGEVKEGTLKVEGILYQPFVSSKRTALTHLNLPTLSRGIGTVHSHPGGTGHPSGQDLSFFSRSGIIHLIIAYPYNDKTINCYDAEGNPLDFAII